LALLDGFRSADEKLKFAINGINLSLDDMPEPKVCATSSRGGVP
jgi:hypothetical protein